MLVRGMRARIASYHSRLCVCCPRRCLGAFDIEGHRQLQRSVSAPAAEFSGSKRYENVLLRHMPSLSYWQLALLLLQRCSRKVPRHTWRVLRARPKRMTSEGSPHWCWQQQQYSLLSTVTAAGSWGRCGSGPAGAGATRSACHARTHARIYALAPCLCASSSVTLWPPWPPPPCSQIGRAHV